MGNEKNASSPWNQTPFWNLGWALESGSHPLAYLQAPVSSGWLPPLRSFRSSGHTDPEQPEAWVPQSARAKSFSPLVIKLEKGQRRATRMVVKIQVLGTSVPEGSDASSVLLPSSFAWQTVTQGRVSPWQQLLLFCSAWSLQSPPPLPPCTHRYPLTAQRGGLADSAGGGEWIKRIDFSGRGRKTLMLEMHTQDWEETLTSCRCRGGEDAFSSSEINHPRPKQGEEALCSSSDPRAHFVISGLRVYWKSTGYEKPCWFSPGMQNQMRLQLKRLAGESVQRGQTETQIQEERGAARVAPARAEARLPSGKATATNSVPSYSGTGTFKGLNRRQHQLSSRGELQGSRPAGCSAQTATCLRRGMT